MKIEDNVYITKIQCKVYVTCRCMFEGEVKTFIEAEEILGPDTKWKLGEVRCPKCGKLMNREDIILGVK